MVEGIFQEDRLQVVDKLKQGGMKGEEDMRMVDREMKQDMRAVDREMNVKDRGGKLWEVEGMKVLMLLVGKIQLDGKEVVGRK